MKRLVMAMVGLCAAHAVAMPTQAELKKAQPLVVELMAPAMAEFKSASAKEKTAAAVKVADTSVAFANAAETEAAKFLLLKGAVSFYTRGEAYDKAADAVTALQTNVKDVTPAVIAEITGKATGKISETKAPRLFALYRSAKLQVRAASEAKSLAQKLKKVKSDALQRRYAETLAVSGDWKAAYGAFAKLSDAKLKAVVEAEAEGKVKNVESGEFWWAYEPDLEDAEDIFKAHAAAFYRKALDAGEITGLKKNIVEQRIKPYGDAVAAGGVTPIKPSPVVTKQLTHAGYLTKDNIPLWKGVSLNDIRGFTATIAGGHVSHPGKVVGHVVASGDGWKSVQFQLVDGVGGQDFLKCVYSRFEQSGDEVRGHVEKAAVADASVAIGTDLRTVKSAKEYYLCFNDKGGGYGLKDLVATVGGKSASVVPETTPSTDSIELKTGGDSPFTVKGNEATLTLKSGVKLEFVKCPSGLVKVVDDYEKKSTRKARITRPFWIMKRCLWKNDVKKEVQLRDSYCEDGVQIHPLFTRVEGFCSDLTDDLKSVIPAGYVVRLPSIAEWEYAYHAGSEDPDDEPFGSLLCAHPWEMFVKHTGQTPVNKWGLYDFHAVEKVLDRMDKKSIKVFEKDSARIVRLPDCESKEDLFYWNDAETAATLVRCSPLMKLQIQGGGIGSVRLVIGPDLVSEWKAKNGKK